jgi:hypothetical protein
LVSWAVPGVASLAAIDSSIRPESDGACPTGAADERRSHDTSRLAWGKLLARIAEVFPLVCPACGGDIRLISFITDPTPIRMILAHVASPSRWLVLVKTSSRSVSVVFPASMSAMMPMLRMFWRCRALRVCEPGREAEIVPARGRVVYPSAAPQEGRRPRQERARVSRTTWLE